MNATMTLFRGLMVGKIAQWIRAFDRLKIAKQIYLVKNEK